MIYVSKHLIAYSRFTFPYYDLYSSYVQNTMTSKNGLVRFILKILQLTTVKYTKNDFILYLSMYIIFVLSNRITALSQSLLV